MTDNEMTPDEVVEHALSAEPATRISVTCDGRGSHAMRVLATFRSTLGDRWVLDSMRYPRSSPDEAIRHRSKPSARFAAYEGAPKYEIECKLCRSKAGNPFKIQPRAPKLFAALDALRHAGIASIDARALAATV